ncbi:LPXTG cell wall anchor domain-containing protein [Phytomonospora sp. NPDC050363]|uniref:LPXTG cell wall anchor domain-containing protein n=1 Tax=Phytomonospora sp. NPDC050363 TaxID=3155642 RepID=UPI0033F4B5B6
MTKKALRFGLPTFLAAAATAVAMLLASPAYATTNTISLRDAHQGTKAADFGKPSCDQVPGGPLTGQDGWVFVLPGAVGAEGNFLSLTVTFADLGGVEHVVQIPGASGGIVSGSGDNKAYAITEAGWTLVDATAVVEGGNPNGIFNLTHTCPGTEGGGPSPSTSPSVTESPTASPTATPTPTTTPSSSQTPTGPTPSSSTTAPAPTTTTTTPGGLPVTGAGLTGILVAGVALAAAGTAALLFVRRRRAVAGAED